MTPGQVAYTAYSEAVGGASAVTGTVLLSWAGTTDQTRVAWEAAAGAVLERFGHDESSSIPTWPGSDRIVLPPDTPQPG